MMGTLSCFAFIFVAALVFFKALDAVMGIRVSPEAGIEGLDVPEMGGHGYPEIQGPSTVVHMPPSPARMLGAVAPEPGR